jgi:hypothetical protein
MGDYSHLTIGDLVFTWKYQVPTFITFLFKEEDLFIKREEVVEDPDDDEPVEIDPDELEMEEAGFRTTVAAAKAVLDGYGYTLKFFADIYDSFRDGLQEAIRETLDDEIGGELNEAGQFSEEELQRRVRAHISASPDTALGDLQALTSFVRRAIETDLQMEPFFEDVVMGHDRGQERPRMAVKDYVRFYRHGRSNLADFENLQMLIVGRASRVPADVLRPLLLFSDGYVAMYPEVLSLLYTRIVLDAMPNDDFVVELDVQQVVETEAELRSLHSDLAYELLHKVDVYERVFRALSDREEHVQDRYARTQVRNALGSLERADDAQAKGEALESLMAAAFSIRPQLQVVERTYSTGDEEIDLVVKNNVSRPFWQGLGSPLLFVECKNWAAPVGAPEVRNFEVKLQNHAPLARVGILVAPGGFTNEVSNAIKRSSRDPYTLAQAKRADLEELANGGESVLDWLERLLCRPI